MKIHIAVVNSENSETACGVEEARDNGSPEFVSWFATVKRTRVLSEVTCGNCLRINRTHFVLV